MATRAKGQSEERRKRRAKFHGVVVHVPPEGAEPVEDGSHVVVSVAELAFGRLPEPGDAELTFGIALATKDASGARWLRESHESGPFYYVRENSSLNVRDWVVFDGPVHRHLSLQVEIAEIEHPQRTRKDLNEVVKTVAESMGRLGAASADPARTVLQVVPAAYAAALAANGDDQVLKLLTSLFTRGAGGGDGLPALSEGLHLFEKRRPTGRGDAPGAGVVRLALRVRRVG